MGGRVDLCGISPDAAQIVEVRLALREGPQSLDTLEEKRGGFTSCPAPRCSHVNIAAFFDKTNPLRSSAGE